MMHLSSRTDATTTEEETEVEIEEAEVEEDTTIETDHLVSLAITVSLVSIVSLESLVSIVTVVEDLITDRTDSTIPGRRVDLKTPDSVDRLRLECPELLLPLLPRGLPRRWRLHLRLLRNERS